MINNIRDISIFTWLICFIILLLSFFPVSIKQASNKIRCNRVETRWVGDNLSPKIYESWLIKSPLFFASPSIYGYSSDINDALMKTDLRFAKTIQREYYLDTNVKLYSSDSINSDNLKNLELSELAEPIYNFSSKYFYYPLIISDNLKDRFIEGSLLDSIDLNSSFFIRAQVEVSKFGRIEHLFIDSEIENQEWNQVALNVLYNLRFKSGVRDVGWIELKGNK